MRGAEIGWSQWGGGPQHTGAASLAAQPARSILAEIVADPFVDQEIVATGGELLAHYAVPLADGADVYVEMKSGQYISCPPPGSGLSFPCGPGAWASQTWGVQKLTWRGGALVPAWTAASDWKPVPAGGTVSGWEPVFHPVLAGDSLYMPGGGGSVLQVSKSSGAIVARMTPFDFVDARIYVAGGLAADAAGNVFYDAIELDPDDPWGRDALGAWLVRIGRDGRAAKVSFTTLVPSAPVAAGPCETNFSERDLPWPPGADVLPPTTACGSQRPGINVVPAIAPDGTVYTASVAHRNSRYAYVVAAGNDLSPMWAASLRGRLSDGCDVLLPPSGTPGGCRAGSRRGVDPATNTAPAGQVLDAGSSSPVVLPDGGILFGAFTRYNYARGHLFKFSRSGELAATYDFGWDITPAVFGTTAAYSILLKDNHYDVGSYCGDPVACPPERPRYDLVSLDPNLALQWRFTNTNTLSCSRSADGSVTCASDHPNGFEWCVNQPAVDASGVVYANSEDGNLYAIGPDGTLKGKLFLDLALGAAYTPVSIGPEGILYSENFGRVFAIGNPTRAPQTAPRHGATRRLGER